MILFEPLDLWNEICFGTFYFIFFMVTNSFLIKKIIPGLAKDNFRLIQTGMLLRLLASVAFGVIHLTIYKNPVSDTGNYHLFSVY